MKPQTQGLQLSLLIHAVVILGVLGLSLVAGTARRPVVIDFNLEKSIPAPPSPVQKREDPVQKTATPPEKKAIPPRPLPVPREEPRPLPPAEAPKVRETPTWIHATSDLTVPAENPGVPNVPGGFSKAEGKTGTAGTALGFGRGGSGGGGGTAEAGAAEKAKSRYLAEHFAFIRDKILQNVVYPPLARRLGWQGKVVLTFVIKPNGIVKEAQMTQGSGHELLDQSAMEALKGSEPFPQPPAEARITIPIVYKLN
ncbi:MAG: energy transducer TonB [Deltaproteobacteria bacterium]|nr:energy transducer TonB [Deltaproteobacteria bacterium]